MVAPNGARRMKTDHHNLPMTIGEIVVTAKACSVAGADGIHAHVRDEFGKHVLDAGLYLELVSELTRNAPELYVQITTEAVGQYKPHEQNELVRKVVPKAVSVALREMAASDYIAEARQFYHWSDEANIEVQHILYDPTEIGQLCKFIADGIIPSNNLQLLFVLGKYGSTQKTDPTSLDPFLAQLKSYNLNSDWAVCAFGDTETACLSYANNLHGKLRVGFENSLWNSDGELAADNAERVSEVVSTCGF
jgi:3-keto-5-aminohexanoate cleavage enzyme